MKTKVPRKLKKKLRNKWPTPTFGRIEHRYKGEWYLVRDGEGDACNGGG